MAFCRFCGKELKEGEVCGCQAAEAPKTETAAPVAEAPKAEEAAPKTAPGIPVPDKGQVTQTAKNIWKSFLGVYRHPVTEGKAFVANADMPVSLCFIVLQAVLASVFGCVLVGKINGVFDLGGGFLDSYKFSGVKAFFLTLLFSIVFSALLVLLFWLAKLILRLKGGLKQLLALAAVRSIAVLPFMLISIIFGLFNPGLGIGVFYGSVLLALCFLLEAVKGFGEMKEDRALYAVFIVMFVFVLLCIFIASKACMLYVPEGLKGMGSLSSFLY